jgi:hypothetical protein
VFVQLVLLKRERAYSCVRIVSVVEERERAYCFVRTFSFDERERAYCCVRTISLVDERVSLLLCSYFQFN